MSSFPTVATVMGLSKEVAESGPLLATIAVPNAIAPQNIEPEIESVEIKASDPVTQAVVDNIIGILPTKKEPVALKCEVCNITVFSELILQTHCAGAKHARKLKGQELIKEINTSPHSQFVASSTQNGVGSTIAEFTCKLCNVKLNSQQQLQQHLSGAKHKTKAEANKVNTTEVSVSSNNGEKGLAKVDVGANRLYCAACNVHVNSDLQLHQHITSNKHINKVNGRSSGPNRVAPYKRPIGQSGANQSSSFNQPSTEEWRTNQSEWRSYQPDWKNNQPEWKKRAATGWSPNATNMDSTDIWSRRPSRMDVEYKPFVSGGLLY